MIFTTPKSIRLNGVRGEQLDFLAAKLGTSATGAIEYMLKKEIEAGMIEATLPRLAVATEGEFVTLTVDTLPVRMSAKDATDLVDTIRYSLDRRNDAMTIHVETMISVSRRGVGFIVEARPVEGHAKVAATRGVMEDLADQLASAAKAASEVTTI